MSTCTSYATEDIGVVVIGRNEGELLTNCLASIKASYIVYVDSGSVDGSAEAAERMGISVVRLDLAQPFTAARARNEGVAYLRALQPDLRFVQFVDGDCALVPGWLGTALSFLRQRKDVAIVCGRRRERHPEISVYNRLCDLEWNTPVGEARACGGDSLVRVQAFEEVGGFLPTLIAGEEPELCARLRERGWRIWRLDAEMTVHNAALSRFSQWWVRAVRSGYGYAQVSRLHIHSPFGIYRRQTSSAVVWGGVVPLAIGFGTLIHPAVIGGALIYPIQISRIAILRGADVAQNWTYALFVMLAKFAELQGILKFYWHRWCRHTVGLIEYKQIS
jgi:glycosyltransferase involved in cell wall biosynthesis